MEELRSLFPELPSLSHGTTNLALEMVEVNKHYHCTTAVSVLRPHQVQMQSLDNSIQRWHKYIPQSS